MRAKDRGLEGVSRKQYDRLSYTCTYPCSLWLKRLRDYAYPSRSSVHRHCPHSVAMGTLAPGTVCRYCFILEAHGYIPDPFVAPICRVCDDRSQEVGFRSIGLQRSGILGDMWAAMLAATMSGLPTPFHVDAVKSRIYLFLFGMNIMGCAKIDDDDSWMDFWRRRPRRLIATTSATHR